MRALGTRDANVWQCRVSTPRHCTDCRSVEAGRYAGVVDVPSSRQGRAALALDAQWYPHVTRAARR
jgi:hypothetical protein